VQFSEAVGVFGDDYAITIRDDESDSDEQRFLTLGMGIKGRILVVVYCYSGRKHPDHLSSLGRAARTRSI